MSKVRVKIENVSKSFRLYSDPTFSIKKAFLNLFRTRDYTDFYALDSVTFDIFEGDFVGIIGRNGSGKSTLLKIVSGIYEPDAGQVEVNGRIIPFLELGVGFNPELTARENIYLNGVILGMNRAFVDKKFDEMVDFAEIRPFLDVPIKNFSSGMQVRLAFSIAVQVEADIYILDEVLSVGDAAFQLKCIDRLKELIAAKKTIIFVSHSMEDIKKYCSKVVWMDHGKVCEIGEPVQMVEKYLASLK